jgi:hypothetical protein
MYLARRHLLEVHRNPLGLLYSYYGNPDLRVEPGLDGDLAPACERRSADQPDTPLASDPGRAATAAVVAAGYATLNTQPTETPRRGGR